METKIEHRLTEVEVRSKNNEERIEAVEKRQDNLDELVSTVKVLVNREERVEEDVREIKTDVKSLTEKPAKRWDTMVDKIMWAVLAAIIAFLLAKVGL